MSGTSAETAVLSIINAFFELQHCIAAGNSKLDVNNSHHRVNEYCALLAH